MHPRTMVCAALLVALLGAPTGAAESTLEAVPGACATSGPAGDTTTTCFVGVDDEVAGASLRAGLAADCWDRSSTTTTTTTSAAGPRTRTTQTGDAGCHEGVVVDAAGNHVWVYRIERTDWRIVQDSGDAQTPKTDDTWWHQARGVAVETGPGGTHRVVEHRWIHVGCTTPAPGGPGTDRCAETRDARVVVDLFAPT